MSGIESMASDWRPRLAHAQKMLEEAKAEMLSLNADVGDTPVSQAAKEVASALVGETSGLLSRIDDVNAATQAADRTEWDFAERNAGRPDAHKWAN